ncbi:MAG: T9SS type A sorting domain-containing protein [Bacteroidia bacterium]
MKKLLTVFFILLLTVSSFAQMRMNNNPHTLHLNDFEFSNAQNNSAFGKTLISDWYTPIKYDTFSLTHLQTGIAFMMHDSLAKIFYADGTTGTNQWLGFGRVLDPKDTMISISGTPVFQLSRYNGFMLDSIRFAYAYVRNVDTFSNGNFVKDTLFIHYFLGNEISKYAFNPSLNRFALVDWIGDSIRLPKNYYATDTIILRKNDSTGVANMNGKFENYFNMKTFTRKCPNGITMNAMNGANTNNLIAYSVVFKSGVPTVSGNDTAIMIWQKDPATIPTGRHRTNYFGFLYTVNTDTVAWSNPNFYSTSLLAPSWAAYVASSGWLGFVSGNAFTHEYFINADFRLITDPNVAITEINNSSVSGFNLFPNPVHQNEKVFLNFKLNSRSEIKMQMVNILGQQVKSMESLIAEPGNHSKEISMDHLSAGIYFLNFLVNGEVHSRKMVVIE